MSKLSRFLSLVLRHKPSEIGIELDKNGWVDTSILIKKIKAYGIPCNDLLLREAVETDDKKRFSFSENNKLIRAAQGHSVNIDLGLETRIPPFDLYHGTATRFLNSIMETGLSPNGRNKVHLSDNKETAIQVGSRHGKPIVLLLDTVGLIENGQQFWQADNGVWLTDRVAAHFLSII